MSTIAGRSCLICGSHAHSTIFSYQEPDPYELAVGISQVNYMRKWQRCNQCGFFFSIYSRPTTALNKLYENQYRSIQSDWRQNSTLETFKRVIGLPYAKSENKQKIEWLKREIDTLLHANLVNFQAPPYQLLDIGGATGVFAYEFQDDMWAAQIVDPGESGAFIQAEYGIPYHEATYRPGCCKHSLQLISLVFVLEHILDPERLLIQVKKDMGTDTLLFIEVPDAHSFIYKQAGDEIFNACHLWMFSPDTLILLLKKFNLEVYAIQRSKTVRGYYSLKALVGKAHRTPT